MAAETDRTWLLESVGFEVLGTVAEVGSVTARRAWHSVISLAVEPDRKVDQADENALANAEDEWRLYGDELGLFGADGSFLISLSGVGALELPWTHVRGSGNRGFLARLVREAGRADFIAMSVNGHPVVALTEEERDFWITAPDLADVTRCTRQA